MAIIPAGEIDPRRCFENDIRFGYLNSSRSCYCYLCTVAIAAGTRRCYDNTAKRGPICLTCAKSIRTESLASPAGTETIAAQIQILQSNILKLEDELMCFQAYILKSGHIHAYAEHQEKWMTQKQEQKS